MMIKDIGKTLKILRIEAGLTQQDLADKLHVTDKAISKWERGAGFPEISLLPLISTVLDADIDYIMTGEEENGGLWRGLLTIENNIKLSTKIYNKPLIDYVLSYFMLCGIKDITIKTSVANQDYIKKLKYSKFGLNISFNYHSQRPVMIVYGAFILFGSNLTRMFNSCMASAETVKLNVDGKDVPIVFNPNGEVNYLPLVKRAKIKQTSRGMIYIPMDSKNTMRMASDFIKIYEQNHKYKIADLKEIAKNRDLI